MRNEQTPRILELFAGIGGSKVKYIPVGAYDIDETCNSTYVANFDGDIFRRRNICSVTWNELDQLQSDFWMLSPPCQPFMLSGNRRDVNDSRAKPFIHIVEVLMKMQSFPKYILLENVPGFISSVACMNLTETLEMKGYHSKIFILDPYDFGIPNHRKRAYLIAEHKSVDDLAAIDACEQLSNCQKVVCSKPISEFLCTLEETELQKYLVPDRLLIHKECMDIVCRDDTSSNYGTEKLRFFTPIEIQRLMGFPETFVFPEKISIRQRYQLLGSSVNVFIVSKLIQSILNTFNRQ
ncbi:DNA (cytosine-5)-methyltransferase [Trichinella pseudospiralis]|uniref:DNA (Cytosine-5)-methyltransferase n=1 Tax=Trichinella pseudospiralis TaxID=6337 RepID=A0A0V1IED1_TRIPS|nr:DNA (cytosine-5)-methyltransferase [Trichinella pseudospiralis]